jgi:hypothetical protein
MANPRRLGGAEGRQTTELLKTSNTSKAPTQARHTRELVAALACRACMRMGSARRKLTLVGYRTRRRNRHRHQSLGRRHGGHRRRAASTATSRATRRAAGSARLAWGTTRLTQATAAMEKRPMTATPGRGHQGRSQQQAGTRMAQHLHGSLLRIGAGPQPSRARTRETEFTSIQPAALSEATRRNGRTCTPLLMADR